MPENLFHKLLGTDPDVLNPDLYQLLELDRDDVSEDQIEAQYKSKMKRLQEVRSTKYKHFVEFLKGQLQAARRTLSEPKARKRYDEEILTDAVGELKDRVQTFIQISGNLTELEITEIHARGRQLNVPERLVQRLIDRQLEKFGYQRVPPSMEQLERARRILKDRESQGSITDTKAMNLESLLAGLEQEARRRDATRVMEASPRRTDSEQLSLFAPSRVGDEPPPLEAQPAAAANAASSRQRPRLVWTGKGDEMRVTRQMPDGSQERPLIFLSMPASDIGALVERTTIFACNALGLEVYRTRGERWDHVLARLKACDVLIADFSGPEAHPTAPDAMVITHATIAKYTHDKPVLALTQAPPERRLPGWQFVYYDAEHLTDTTGESFPDRLKRALRRNMK